MGDLNPAAPDLRLGCVIVADFQSALDPFQTLRQPIVSCVLISGIRVACRLISLDAGNRRFKAVQAMLYLAHIAFDSCDIRSYGAKVLQCEILDVLWLCHRMASSR
jgi:hypothetical protein